jgi:methyl-accepting chemotaxis protein
VSANAQVAQTRTLLLGVSLLAIVVLVAGARYLSLGITVPLSAMVDAANRAAQGHVGTRVTRIGQGEFEELALAFNALLAKLRETAAGIGGTAIEVTRAARELAVVADDISASAQSQASNLEQTAASMEQLTATVKQNAANAGQANQLAGAARTVAEQGGSVVGAAVSAMSEINRSSRRIGDIITTIDEIAFQTNLLALNAAVEAARAGSHGRGFAVVAAEVRSLAGRSAAAAKEIKGLIGESSEKVEQGSAHVNRSGTTLDEIVVGVKRVTDIVAEIAAASREQSVGIEEVNRAVSQMDQLTQSNAAQTEELSATAGTLASQAGELESLLAWFKLDDGDGGVGAGHAAPRSGAQAIESPRASARGAGRPLGSGRSQRSSAAAVSRDGVHHQTAVSASTDSDGFVDF